MSYTFLLEQGEESSAESFSDIPASVLSRLSLTAAPYYSDASLTEFCQSSQSGMTFGVFEALNGEDELRLFASGRPAKDLALPATCAGLTTSGVDWSSNQSELCARLDPDSFSWRTPQTSLFEPLGELLENWPAWAMTQGPELLALTTPAWTIAENGFGWLRTPCASDGKKWYVSGFTATQRLDAGRQPMLIHQLIEYHGLKKGWANPEFWELMMDWPIGWTDLKPLETARFQQWLNSHGEH